MKLTLAPSPRPALVQRLTRMHTAIRRGDRENLRRAVEIGRLLAGVPAAERKALLGEAGISGRSGRDYIRVFEGRDRLVAARCHSIRQALTVLTGSPAGVLTLNPAAGFSELVQQMTEPGLPMVVRDRPVSVVVVAADGKFACVADAASPELLAHLILTVKDRLRVEIRQSGTFTNQPSLWPDCRPRKIWKSPPVVRSSSQS